MSDAPAIISLGLQPRNIFKRTYKIDKSQKKVEYLNTTKAKNTQNQRLNLGLFFS